MHRGRRSAAVDLKHPDGRELVLRLCASADALIEGFRPGVMERLGLGPDAVLAAQPAARLRAHDRLRAGRADGARRRPRHQLHRGRGRARRDGADGREAADPAQPRRRLRRRRDAARARGGGRDARSARRRARARSSTPRWSRAARCWPPCSTPCARRGCGRTRRARTCSTPARTSTRSTRRATAGTSRWARSSRSSTRRCCGCSSSTPTTSRSGTSRAGPSSRRASPRCSPPARATSGRRCWRARRRARPRCWRSHEAPQHPHNVARGTFVEVDGKLQPAPAPRFSRTPAAISRPPASPGPTPTPSSRLGHRRCRAPAQTLGAVAQRLHPGAARRRSPRG